MTPATFKHMREFAKNAIHARTIVRQERPSPDDLHWAAMFLAGSARHEDAVTGREILKAQFELECG